MFNNQIKYKLLLFPAILLVNLIVSYLIIDHFQEKNKILLNQTKEVLVPSIETSIQLNKILFEIQNSLQYNVASGEIVNFSVTDEISNQFKTVVNNLINKIGSKNEIVSIRKTFFEYYAHARQTSYNMINNPIDENLQNQISIMMLNYNNLKNDLKRFENLNQTIKEKHFLKIETNNNYAGLYNNFIIFFSFILSIFVAFITSRAVSKPFIELNKALENSNEKLLDSNLKLEISQHELKENIVTKDKFFSIIAHDLRGPLGSFIQLSEMLSDELQSLTVEEIAEFANVMKVSSKRIFDLLENLLEWSRMQRGLIPFEPISNNLVEIVNQSIDSIKNNAKIKEIELSIIIKSDLFVLVDKNMIKTVFRNLISNAVKFTPRGGEIKITASKEENNIVILSIQDNGIGMSENIKNQIFAIGGKTNRPGTEGESSSGLGLILCKELIEKHDGNIWVESQENQGSTFYFTLSINNNL